jgi:hypothetical protein
MATESEKFEEYCNNRNIDPQSLWGLSIWDGWQAALSTRKPYGYVVLDKDGDTIHVYRGEMSEEANGLKARLETNFSDSAPYSVLELLYGEQ